MRKSGGLPASRLFPEPAYPHQSSRGLQPQRKEGTMSANTKQSTLGSLGLVWRVAVICAILISGYGASAQLTSKPFSADKVVTKGGKTTTSKVYATPTAVRAEGLQNGKKYIAIDRFDRKVIWSIMPDQKMYVEMQMPSGADAAA